MPTPEGITPTGTLRVAAITVETKSGLPLDCPGCAALPAGSFQDTLLEVEKIAEGQFKVTTDGAVAESWRVAEDGSYTEFTIKEGIPWHREELGMLTAEDVAWTYQQINPGITPESVNDTGGDYVDDYDAVTVHDGNKVRFHWIGGVPRDPMMFAGMGEGVGIFSKKAFEMHGADWMRNNVTGTGPYELDTWIQFSEITGNAVEDHWRKTPWFARYEVLEAPEAATRRAMLETGEVQISQVSLQDYGAVINEGFQPAPEGIFQDLNYLTAGNYWVEKHPVSGELLKRECPDKSWIGCPNDPESMKNAKLVREALSISIDRDGLVQALTGGLGRPSYNGGVSQNVDLMQDNWEEWGLPWPYDPERAKELLAEAGYGDGITIELFSTNSGTRKLVADALASGWRADLGATVEFDTRAYLVYRPNKINRTHYKIETLDRGATSPASEFGEPWIYSAYAAAEEGGPGGGYNAGLELPIANEVQAAMLETNDPEEIYELQDKFWDLMMEQRFKVGLVEMPYAALYDPEQIVEWHMRPISQLRLGGAWFPEWVRGTQHTE